MQVEINAEVILELESKLDWINKVPRHLPKKRYREEVFLWLDSKGNNMVIGEDFTAALELQSYPVKVYRLKRCAEALQDLSVAE